MELLYGKPLADKILSHLQDEIFLSEAKPGLAVLLVGQDEASRIYVNLKEKRAKEIGMNFFRYDLAENISEQEIISRIESLNKDILVQGIIVQLPLPMGFDTEKIIAAIDPKKDADGFHPENVQKFLTGQVAVWPVFPKAIVNLLQSAEQDLIGKKAVVVANSVDFGKMMCAALAHLDLAAAYVLAREIDLELGQISQADVVVSAVGLPGLLRGEMLKDGTLVIDGGISKLGERILGDVDFASTEGKSGWISPVPGGVGPVTIACLLSNVFEAFKAQKKEKNG